MIDIHSAFSQHLLHPALQERLRQLHPYELPELLAVEAASGLPEYLQWLAAESRPVN
uniref:divalent cation tolerance protein CutA n=1 Tax=Enterobacteriaceae TaxID=543 RepID=UPI001E3ABD87